MNQLSDLPLSTKRVFARAGFTILELMLVMLILGLMFGVGAGVLTSLDLAKRATKASVQNAIRAARTSSVARGAAARVRIDPKENRMQAEGIAVLGTWQFEDDLPHGDSPLFGENRGGRYLDDGFIGRAISFNGSPEGSTYEIPVHQDPGFDLSAGFSIDCALRIDAKGGGRAINIGNTVAIEVTSARTLRGWFIPTAIDKSGAKIRGGKTSVESAPGSIERDRWYRVRLDYDRRALQLFVDELEVARADEVGEVWHLEGPLWISDPKSAFPGSIDHVVIAAVTSSAELKLPESLRFDTDAPAEIRFAPGGYLDRELHDEPVVFHLVDQDGKREEIRVGLYGTVE